jgi:hypothetical protein
VNKIALEDLVGEHLLSAVDMDTEQVQQWDDCFEDCQVIRFRLDGKTYTAVEDPSDGYRSSMKYIAVTDDPIKNSFAPVRVLARMKPNDDYYYVNDVLEFIYLGNGQVVLEVGTRNVDDYYPSFVGSFYPENMGEVNALMGSW